MIEVTENIVEWILTIKVTRRNSASKLDREYCENGVKLYMFEYLGEGAKQNERVRRAAGK